MQFSLEKDEPAALMDRIEKFLARTSAPASDPKPVAVVADPGMTKEEISVLIDEAVKSAKPVAIVEEAGALAGFTSVQVMGLPLGQIAVGGFSAVLLSELIDGLLANQSLQMRGIAKAAAAALVVKYMPLIGDSGKKATALLLGFDAVRDLVPIDLWAQKIANKTTGTITQRGLVQGRSPAAVAPRNMIRPADYYGAAFGR